MADRLVKVLENGRLLTRGFTDMGDHVRLLLDDDETLSVSVDWTRWLGSDSISSSENEADGVTTGAISTSSSVNTFTISDPLTAFNGGGGGWVQHRITTTGGQTKELRIRALSPHSATYDDYGWRSL